MNRKLMTIVLETLVFLELAGDDIVDPDAAVSQMEGSVATLTRLTPKEKAEFINFIREYADEEERQRGRPERIEFFRSMPDNFGLSD